MVECACLLQISKDQKKSRSRSSYTDLKITFFAPSFEQESCLVFTACWLESVFLKLLAAVPGKSNDKPSLAISFRPCVLFIFAFGVIVFHKIFIQIQSHGAKLCHSLRFLNSFHRSNHVFCNHTLDLGLSFDFLCILILGLDCVKLFPLCVCCLVLSSNKPIHS